MPLTLLPAPPRIQKAIYTSGSDAYLHCTGSYLMHIDFATQIFNDKSMKV